MSVTISLDTELANKLSRQAQGHQSTLQEWTVRILKDAVENPDAGSSWSSLNIRRLALIAKEYKSELTTDEQLELEALQDVAARACEPQDRKLLEKLRTCLDTDDSSFRTHD
jgi:hypothetical protein